jgi:hypothetical protein
LAIALIQWVWRSVTITSNRAESSDEKQREINPLWIGLIMAIACFLFPEGIWIRLGDIGIDNYIWNLELEPYFRFQVYPLESLMWNIVLYVFTTRLIFANQVVRLYRGKTTGKRVYLTSFLAISLELVLFLGNTLSLLWVPDYPYAFRPIPLPILLLTAIVLIMIFPPEAKERSWIESEAKVRWWGPKIRNESP